MHSAKVGATPCHIEQHPNNPYIEGIETNGRNEMTFEAAFETYNKRMGDKSPFCRLVGARQETILANGEQDLDEAFRIAVEHVAALPAILTN